MYVGIKSFLSKTSADVSRLYFIKQYLTVEGPLFYRVDGLEGIVVADRDGVPVLEGEYS